MFTPSYSAVHDVDGVRDSVQPIHDVCSGVVSRRQNLAQAPKREPITPGDVKQEGVLELLGYHLISHGIVAFKFG